MGKLDLNKSDEKCNKSMKITSVSTAIIDIITNIIEILASKVTDWKNNTALSEDYCTFEDFISGRIDGKYFNFGDTIRIEKMEDEIIFHFVRNYDSSFSYRKYIEELLVGIQKLIDYKGDTKIDITFSSWILARKSTFLLEYLKQKLHEKGICMEIINQEIKELKLSNLHDLTVKIENAGVKKFNKSKIGMIQVQISKKSEIVL